MFCSVKPDERCFHSCKSSCGLQSNRKSRETIYFTTCIIYGGHLPLSIRFLLHASHRYSLNSVFYFFFWKEDSEFVILFIFRGAAEIHDLPINNFAKNNSLCEIFIPLIGGLKAKWYDFFLFIVYEIIVQIKCLCLLFNTLFNSFLLFLANIILFELQFELPSDRCNFSSSCFKNFVHVSFRLQFFLISVLTLAPRNFFHPDFLIFRAIQMQYYSSLCCHVFFYRGPVEIFMRFSYETRN